MFQFMSDFIYQSGSRDVVVCLVAKYENDSTTQTVSHVNMTGQSQIRIPENREGTLKELRGFIYLNNNDRANEVRKMLFISQIQLIRFHSKEKKDEPKPNDENKKDSLSGAADRPGNGTDSTSRGGQQRQGGRLLPSDKGAAVHRVDKQSFKTMRK
jgi:hypothetical protein